MPQSFLNGKFPDSMAFAVTSESTLTGFHTPTDKVCGFI
jgi:hypothetical protein